MDTELKDIKGILEGMNGCLYTMSSNSSNIANAIDRLQNNPTSCSPITSSYTPSIESSVNNISISVQRIAQAVDNMQCNMFGLTQAIQTLAEIQCHVLAHMQGEVPEKKAVPWGAQHFKNGWAEDMEPSEAGKNLEEQSF